MDSSSDPFDGVLLVGHGTREAAGIAEFWQVVERVAQQLRAMASGGCFLELAEPTIPAGLAALAGRGAKRIRAVPLVLFAAGHAKHDIPQAVKAGERSLNGVEVRLMPHLGCHPAILELSERRYREALQGRGAFSAADTQLILVGRGSNDAEATAQMQEFARLRALKLPGTQVDTAFLAMAEPRLDAALDRAARSATRRVVVQPHLLFTGLLLGEVREKVARLQTLQPGREWIVTQHLGPDKAVATAVLDIALENSVLASPV